MASPTRPISAKLGTLPIGASQYTAQRARDALATYTGALSAAGAYAHLVTLPTIDLAAGRVLLGPFDPTVNMKLKFHGTHGTDAAGKVGAFSLWGLEEFQGKNGELEYLGDLIYSGTITIGNAAVHAGSALIPAVGGVSHKWVSSIVPSLDLSRGAITIGQTTDGVANLFFDFLAYPYYVLEMTCNGALAPTGLGAVYRQL